jgi:hypothetical protein
MVDIATHVYKCQDTEKYLERKKKLLTRSCRPLPPASAHPKLLVQFDFPCHIHKETIPKRLSNAQGCLKEQ